MFSKIRILGSYRIGLGPDTELHLHTIIGREIVIYSRCSLTGVNTGKCPAVITEEPGRMVHSLVG